MNRKSLLLIIVAVLLIGGGTGYANARNSKVKKNAEIAQQESVTGKGKLAKDDVSVKINETNSQNSGDAVMAKGIFNDYDTAKLVNADKGDVVLFFSAAWCPTCQEANKNFTAKSTPDGLTLLKIDYDKSTDLKKMYGVTYQHTFVQVDKNGKLLKKWSGSTTYDQLNSEIVKRT